MPNRYTVKQGDQLHLLAKKFGVSTSALLAANPGVSSVVPGISLEEAVADVDPGPVDRIPTLNLLLVVDQHLTREALSNVGGKVVHQQVGEPARQVWGR